MTLDRIRQTLSEEPAVLFARWFGSRATGKARPDSDWDVAVYVDERLDARQRFDLRRRLTAALNGSNRPVVDLVVLNDAPPLLAHRALQGRDLLTRDRRAYVRFFIRTLGQADDERFFQAVHARARRRRLAEGRFGRP